MLHGHKHCDRDCLARGNANDVADRRWTYKMTDRLDLPHRATMYRDPAWNSARTLPYFAREV